MEIKVGQQVVIRSGDAYELHVVGGETPQRWKINNIHFSKKGTTKHGWYDLQSRPAGWKICNDGEVTDELLSHVEETNKRRQQSAERVAAETAKKDAWREANKQWKESPEGIDQRNRDHNLAGLSVEIEERGDNYGRLTIISLVGPYKGSFDTDFKSCKYVNIEVRQDSEWDDGWTVRTWEEPEISLPSGRVSYKASAVLRAVITKAEEIAEQWDSVTGTPVEPPTTADAN
jgi:hypothetical protein